MLILRLLFLGFMVWPLLLIGLNYLATQRVKMYNCLMWSGLEYLGHICHESFFHFGGKAVLAEDLQSIKAVYNTL